MGRATTIIVQPGSESNSTEICQVQTLYPTVNFIYNFIYITHLKQPANINSLLATLDLAAIIGISLCINPLYNTTQKGPFPLGVQMGRSHRQVLKSPLRYIYTRAYQ